MANEILENIDAPLVVDPFKRTITIPNKGKILGVYGDTKITRVDFKIEKYYDGTDMFNTFKNNIRILYVNANGDANFYLVPLSGINPDPNDENAFIVTWILDSDVTAYVGTVKFAVSMILTDENDIIKVRYSTTIATAKVLDGISAETYIPPEEQEDILSKFKAYIDAEIKAGFGPEMEQKIEEAIDEKAGPIIEEKLNGTYTFAGNLIGFKDIVEGIDMPQSPGFKYYAYGNKGYIEGEGELKGIQLADGNTFAPMDLIIGEGVTSIADGVFFKSNYPQNIELPYSLTTIGAGAFNNSNLRKIVIKANTVYVNMSAFSASLNLRKVEFLSDIGYFGDTVFASCTKLREVILPAKEVHGSISSTPSDPTYERLSSGMFAGCTALECVYLPAEAFGGVLDAAFENCKSLRNIVLRSGQTVIGTLGQNAFSRSGLITITVPSVTDTNGFGLGLFSNCQSLQSAYVYSPKNTTKTISGGMFEGCEHLSHVELEDDFLEIGNNAFGNCKDLKYMELPNTIKKINDYAFHDSGLVELVIPHAINNIGYGAFRQCPNLVTVVKDEFSNYTIGDYAFYDCPKLKSFKSLKYGLTSIGSKAFNQCGSLEEVELPTTVTSIASDAFDSTFTGTLRIHKTEGSIAGAPWGATNATIVWGN